MGVAKAIAEAEPVEVDVVATVEEVAPARGRPGAVASAAEAARPPEFRSQVEVGLDSRGRWWPRHSDSVDSLAPQCDQIV